MSSTEMSSEELSSLRSKLSQTERILKAERKDREQEEKKSLELLEEVKKKWEAKERDRIQEKDKQISSLRTELDETVEVKKGLKSKLKECRARLDEAINKYEEERKRNGRSVLSSIDGNSGLASPAKKASSVSSPAKVVKEECKDCEKNLSEMKLQKVEVRLAEKKAKELESRLKFVREVMLKEEKEAREKAEAKVAEAEEAVEIARKEGRAEGRKEKEELETKLEEERKRAARLEEVETELREKAAGLEAAERSSSRLEREVAEAREAASSHETLKHTCLELQDQLAEYEKLSGKFEKQLEESKIETARLEKDLEAREDEVAELKTERNEVRSQAIYAESRLKEAVEDAAREAARKAASEANLKAEKEKQTWNDRLAKLERINDEQLRAFNSLREEYDRINKQCERLESELEDGADLNVQLKEENAMYHTKASELEESNEKLHKVMEEMLEKIADRNKEIKEKQSKLDSVTSILEKKELESSVQISQLKKLVDHLSRDAEAPSRAKTSSKGQLDWAMSYEEVQEQLDRERGRNRNLIEELKTVRAKAMSSAMAASATPATAADVPLEEAAVRDLTKKKPVAETAHAIPHRFHRQTNMRHGQKCPVCTGNLPLCRAVSACKFCSKTVHVGCEAGAGEDCGLSSDLALVLRSNASNSQGVAHKGYLKVPETSPDSAPGKEWKSVPVQIVKEKLVVNKDGKELEINLRPERGTAFVQGAVAYAELSHTSAFDQPHVFKVCYSSGPRVRETHYFMAKTFQEKAAWIEALEKVTLTPQQRDDPHDDDDAEPEPVSLSPNKNKGNRSAMVDWDVVGTFGSDSGVNPFCAITLADSSILVGTSQGLYLSSAASGSRLASPFARGSGPESVFQMSSLSDLGELLMVVGPERRLVVAREKDVLLKQVAEKHQSFRYRNIEVVSSCHKFAAHKYSSGEAVFVCAADDSRVTILRRHPKTGEYQIKYGFTTDLPTSCVAFGCDSGEDDDYADDDDRFVLVATDKVYRIGLKNFEVREFLSFSPESGSKLVEVFPLQGGKEFLLCFQDYGLFVDSFGRESRGEIRWGGSGSSRRAPASQFHFVERKGPNVADEMSPSKMSSPSKRFRLTSQLWLARNDVLEGFDVDISSASAFPCRLKCRNPQLLSSFSSDGQRAVVFAEKRADTVVVRALNKK